ncbi:MAG: CDP-diacylglycerol--glycerol-3-phosphate 3-phosphatidyltransferase [Candidatus Dormibacteria bacterium]|jgi:CDP-diacylglycerol--glycerol-3-phosphate 3-phosphatidyltransferase
MTAGAVVPRVRSKTRTTVVALATGLRLALTPVVVWLVLDGHDVAAALAFAVAATTDYLDGYLARRWQVTTATGSFFDTTADKVLVTGALIALLAVGRASPWAVLIIIARELTIMGMRGSAAMGGVLVVPSQLGRIKALVQFLAILVTIINLNYRLGPLGLDQWAIWVAVAVTAGSAADYLYRWSSSTLRQRPGGS